MTAGHASNCPCLDCHALAIREFKIAEGTQRTEVSELQAATLGAQPLSADALSQLAQRRLAQPNRDPHANNARDVPRDEAVLATARRLREALRDVLASADRRGFSLPGIQQLWRDADALVVESEALGADV